MTDADSGSSGRAIVRVRPEDCFHDHVEILEVVEDDPGPNEGWHDVKAECQDCGTELSCLIDWGALQSDVEEVR